jgi:hypothetical protein
MGICRLSGKLPGPACDRVITEYFARGAVPTQVCQEHYFFTDSGQLAAAYSGSGSTVASTTSAVDNSDAHRAAAQVSDVRAVEAPAKPSDDIVMASETEDRPKKKRGFWGKLFGRGDKDDKPKPSNFRR